METLKGGVTYTEGEAKYVWHSTDNACEKCQELNSKAFNSIDEIPDRPHPNCRCWIEDKKKDEEKCDCWNIIDGFKELIGHANSLKDELASIISSVSHNLGNFYKEKCQQYLQKSSRWNNALGDFSRNYTDMVEADTIGADKYFHAKANCQAAQRGVTGEKLAVAQSFFRELEEGTRKVIFEGENLVKQVEDARKDMEANKEGRELGKVYPNVDCGDLLDYKKPNGLPDRY